MQEKSQAEAGERADGAGDRKRPAYHYPVTEHRIFETPDGRIVTGWNEGRFVFASFIYVNPDNPDEVVETEWLGDHRRTKRLTRVEHPIPKLCYYTQLDAVDGEALFDAISRSARRMKKKTRIDLYEYVNKTVERPGVANPNDPAPVTDVSDRTIRDRIKEKRPEAVITALAYLKTPISGLTDKAGCPIVSEYAPTEDESREALKQWVGFLLDAAFDCGHGEVGSTVTAFLEVVLQSIELGRPSEAIADDMVRTVVDSVDANVLTCRKLLWRLEAEREKAMGVTLLPPDDYDWPFEDVGGIRRPQML